MSPEPKFTPEKMRVERIKKVEDEMALEIKPDEIFLGNFEDVNPETGEFQEQQEEEDRISFENMPYNHKRKINAYDANGSRVPNRYGLVVSKSEHAEFMKKNNRE